MASLRDIRRRIRSVESTQQITKAMKMVAASKLRRFEARLRAFRPYALGYSDVIARISSQLRDIRHPYMTDDSEPVYSGRIGLLAITADRGLCGGFNSSIGNRTRRFLAEEGASAEEVSLVMVGRKGRDFMQRRGVPVENAYVNPKEGIDYEYALRITSDLLEFKRKNNLSAIHMIFMQFHSAISQDIVVEQLLPVTPPPIREGQKTLTTPYIFEPDPEDILEAVLEKTLAIKIYRGLLESATSEQGARMTAMDSATTNAGELIDGLTLSLNRARQALITKEISEIVGGAEALK